MKKLKRLKSSVCIPFEKIITCWYIVGILKHTQYQQVWFFTPTNKDRLKTWTHLYLLVQKTQNNCIARMGKSGTSIYMINFCFKLHNLSHPNVH